MCLKIFGNGIVDVQVVEYFLKVVDPAVQKQRKVDRKEF